MAERWHSAHSLPSGHHLPPLEIVPALCRIKEKGKRKIRPIYTIETPLDVYGVPDPERIITTLVDEIQAPYEWPGAVNIHHLAHPRSKYESTELGGAYRNDASLMLLIPIQLHNLAHVILEPPPMPNEEVMRQRVMEQRRRDILFEYGRRALRYARWSDQMVNLAAADADEAWLEHTRGYYGARSRIESDRFYRTLETMPEPEMGILPTTDELMQLGIVSATRLLGRQAAASAMDYRHFSQDATYRRAA